MGSSFFKFLDSQYVPDLIADGKIRFGHLDYYRLLEIVFQDKTIGDSHEGRAETDLSNITMGPGTRDPNMEALLRKVGMAPSPESTVVLGEGVSFIHQMDAYIFCFSHFSSQDDYDCKEAPGDLGYNSCIRILDPDRLVQAIRQGTIVSVGKWHGKNVSDLFDVNWCEVTYVKSLKTNAKETLTVNSPDPFLKLEEYSSQKEARIVLFPKQSRDGEFFSVKIANPSEQFERVLLPKSAATPETPTLSSLDNLRRVLTEIDFFEASVFRILDPQLSDFERRQDRKASKESWTWIRLALSDRKSPILQLYISMRRADLMSAYWSSRTDFPSERIDRAIIDGWDTAILRIELKRYAANPLFIPPPIPRSFIGSGTPVP